MILIVFVSLTIISNLKFSEADMTTKYLCGHMERSDLTQVQVVRSLAPMEQIGFRKTRSFVVYGLARPQEFVALVEAFKTSQQHGSYEGGTELTASLSSSPSYRQPTPQQQGFVAGQHFMQPQVRQFHFSQPPPATMEETIEFQSPQQPPYLQQSQVVHGDSDVVAAI